eukprot:TRINITY_DN2739_c0_g1_i1.p1 TRINITY_DN2739_c0_g1~~TRINITY_DN2739_c0_g1_i1.p1  ORF type:complete len:205 (+),score=71.00 TRINITY_DN2739_c0_g1_i1:170-784(+)
MCIRDRSTGARVGAMVKRSMKGKPKSGDKNYDVEQLERKRRKKEGTEAVRGPSTKPEFKRKRKHRNRNKSWGDKTTWEEEPAAADGEETGREAHLADIKKRLAKDAEGASEQHVIGAPRTKSSGVNPDKLKWQAVLKEYLEQEGVEDGPLKDNLTRLLKFQNVPVNRKKAKFINFVRESLALFEEADQIEQMWEVFHELTKSLN